MEEFVKNDFVKCKQVLQLISALPILIVTFIMGHLYTIFGNEWLCCVAHLHVGYLRWEDKWKEKKKSLTTILILGRLLQVIVLSKKKIEILVLTSQK